MKLDSLLSSLRIYRISDRYPEQQQNEHRRQRSNRKKLARKGQTLPPEQGYPGPIRLTQESLDEIIQFISKFYPEWDFDITRKDNEPAIRITESSTGKLLRVLNMDELIAIEAFCKSKQEGAALPSSILDVQA